MPLSEEISLPVEIKPYNTTRNKKEFTKDYLKMAQVTSSGSEKNSQEPQSFTQLRIPKHVQKASLATNQLDPKVFPSKTIDRILLLEGINYFQGSSVKNLGLSV